MLSKFESVYANGNRDSFLIVSSPYVAGTHPFTRLVSKLDGLIENERAVFETVLLAPLPPGWTIAFSQICQGAVDSCCSAGACVAALTEQAGVNGEGFAVLLDVFAALAAALPSLLSRLEGSHDLCEQLARLKGRLLEAVTSALDAVVRDIKSDSSDVSESATVLVLTSDVSGFLRRFKRAEFAFQVYDEIARSSFPPRVCVEALVRTLEAKAAAIVAAAGQPPGMAQAASRAKASLFMVTNLTYTLKNLSAAPELVSTLEDLRGKLQEKVDECSCAGWVEAAEHLAPIPEGTLSFKGKTITFESGRVLKGRFEAFNRDVDDLFSRLAPLSVPDTDLKDMLRVKIAALVVPAVSAFHASWADVAFSKKHQGGYLRYTPAVIQEKVSTLFA
jgi:hypothetical protein